MIARVTPNDGRSLEINLNLNATQDAVTRLVQAIAFRSDLELPALQPRRIRIQLTDGEGAVSKVTSIELFVKEVNEPPVLNQIDTSLEYALNGPELLIAPSARVIDVDSPNLGGGSLLITVLSSQLSSNQIQIRGSEFVIDADRNLFYNGLKVGKEIERVDSIGLKVEFNDQATIAIVQRLLRSVTFSTVGATTRGIRTITLVLLDVDGGFDNKQLHVNVS